MAGEGGPEKRRVKALLSEAAAILGKSERVAQRHRGKASAFFGEVTRESRKTS